MERFDFDALGDKHKRLESVFTSQTLIPGLPTIVRLDGNAFHTFTKGLNRPFDEGFAKCMSETVSYLMSEYNPMLGFHQSDEITLIFHPDKDMVFNGKISKINSLFAAACSVQFNMSVGVHLPHKRSERPRFDCRAWNVPTLDDAAENLLWRSADASRNSLTMAAQSYFSHDALHKVGAQKKHEMLHSVGINWNDYPAHFKRGTFFKKIKVERELTPEILAKIPEHKRPTGPIIRNVVTEFDPGVLTIENYRDILQGV